MGALFSKRPPVIIEPFLVDAYLGLPQTMVSDALIARGYRVIGIARKADDPLKFVNPGPLCALVLYDVESGAVSQIVLGS